MFEDYSRVENLQTRGAEGTGLGLPLARKLVELHGGCLSIASQPGAGTTVSVKFPAERVLGGPAG